jgi:hypothetical protein
MAPLAARNIGAWRPAWPVAAMQRFLVGKRAKSTLDPKRTPRSGALQVRAGWPGSLDKAIHGLTIDDASS